jgi:hypothetical protein
MTTELNEAVRDLGNQIVAKLRLPELVDWLSRRLDRSA